MTDVSTNLSKWAIYANLLSRYLLTSSTFFLLYSVVKRQKNCIFVTPETLILLSIGAAFRYQEVWSSVISFKWLLEKVQIVAPVVAAWYIIRQQRRVNAEFSTCAEQVGEDVEPLLNAHTKEEDEEKENSNHPNTSCTETVINPMDLTAKQAKTSPAFLLDTNQRWICTSLLISLLISSWNQWSIPGLFLIKLFNLAQDPNTTSISYSSALSFQLLFLASMLEAISPITQYARIIAINTIVSTSTQKNSPLSHALATIHPKHNQNQKTPLAIWTWFLTLQLAETARLPQIAVQIIQNKAEDAVKWWLVGAFTACVPFQMVLFLVVSRFFAQGARKE